MHSWSSALTPKNQRQKYRQRLFKRFVKAREEAQLIGLIPTEPAGAVRNERVDPATQESQPLPRLDMQAIRRGWATPEEKKPVIVDALIQLITNVNIDPRVLVQAARTLNQADKDQWERDNPDEAGRAAGAPQTSVSLYELAQKPDPLEEAKANELAVGPSVVVPVPLAT